jgi:hypothetical protein
MAVFWTLVLYFAVEKVFGAIVMPSTNKPKKDWPKLNKECRKDIALFWGKVFMFKFKDISENF